jgi:hypothetical protein
MVDMVKYTPLGINFLKEKKNSLNKKENHSSFHLHYHATLSFEEFDVIIL